MGTFVQQTTWGWMIAAYLFLGGLGGAVGAIGIGVDLYLEPHRRMGIFAALSGFVFLAAGTLLLMLDLLQPLKVVFFFMNPSSWIFWGILTISGFMVTSVLYVLPYIKTWPLVDRVAPYLSFLDRWQRWAGLASVLLGAGVTAYTGFLISGVPAISFWHTAGLPLLFSFSAFSTGCAYLMLTRWLLYRREGSLCQKLKRADAVLIVGELIVLAAFYNTVTCCPAAAQYGTRLLLHSAGFVVGFLLLGLLVPLVIELISIAAPERVDGWKFSTYLWPVIGVLILIGGFLLRVYTMQAGYYTYPW